MSEGNPQEKIYRHPVDILGVCADKLAFIASGIGTEEHDVCSITGSAQGLYLLLTDIIIEIRSVMAEIHKKGGEV